MFSLTFSSLKFRQCNNCNNSNRAVKKREAGARGTPLEFRCLLCDAIQTASTATLSNLRRHVARVHEDDFQTYVDLWEIIKKSNRDSIRPLLMYRDS